MSTLVSLRTKDPQWSKHDEQVYVGKDILELLSSSMYVDPLSMYREYMQNSADAFDLESARDPGRPAGAVRIKVDRQSRNIVITDEGLGLNERDFYRRLTSIGGSTKRGTSARGFRGVGRLAGLGYCQELVFRSRPAGKDVVFELRWDSRKVRSLLRSPDSGLDLTGVVAESIEKRTIPAGNAPAHFFEVELRNVVRHRDDRLLNTAEIARYLGQVAPVPFSPEFQFGEEISSFLRENGVELKPLRLVIDDEGVVYRPHRNTVNIGKKVIHLSEAEKFVTQDRDGQVAAVSWILHHEYLGSIPRSAVIGGWRMRAGDIQVGGSDLLEDLFPEARFNGWTVAETHVVDKSVIPNGRRDNFEHSAHFSDLLTRLTPKTKDIVQRCRTSSINRNKLQRLEGDLVKCEEGLAIASKKRTPAFVVESVKDDVNQRLSSLSNATQKSLFSDASLDTIEARIRKIKKRLSSLPQAPDNTDALMDFSPSQRQMLKVVIEAIHLSGEQPSMADKLVESILKRLRSQRI